MKDGSMKCPYLGGGKEGICMASVTRLVPALEDRSSYCSNDEHYRCPMLLSHLLRSSR